MNAAAPPGLPPVPGPRGRAEFLAVALAALAVLATYALIAGTAVSELGSRTAREDYYNRLVDGFGQGRVSLDLPVPAWLTRLPDPYDPAANAPFQGERYAPGRIHDLSYYHGRLFLYFSVVPAVTLFGPWHWLTGGYLSHQLACLVFASLGFLAGAILLDSIRRRCLPGAGAALAGVGTLAAGLVPVVPLVLERSDVWEVPITAAYAFWMLALLATWISLRRPATSWPGLLALSTCAALAIGSRPSGVLGAALLLVPALRLLRPPPGEWGKKTAAALAALFVPIALIAAGLLAYNYARFGDLREFGQKYQLSGGEETAVARFSPGFFWYNFRLYFLEYPGWQRLFPYVRELAAPALPPGHRAGDNPVGVLTLLPFLLCAAALPCGIRRLRDRPRRELAAIAAAILLVFAANAGPLCLFISTCLRYELEFVPALGLLAVLGFHCLAAARQRTLLAAAGAAAAASIAFSLLMTADLRGATYAGHGLIAAEAGRNDEAVALYRRALALRPGTDFAQVGLADIFAREGRFAEAVVEVRKAIDLRPESADLHVNAAYCLFQLGRLDEAAAECDAALKLQPANPDARDAQRAIRRAQGRAP